MTERELLRESCAAMRAAMARLEELEPGMEMATLRERWTDICMDATSVFDEELSQRNREFLLGELWAYAA